MIKIKRLKQLDSELLIMKILLHIKTKKGSKDILKDILEIMKNGMIYLQLDFGQDGYFGIKKLYLEVKKI